ncbi:cytochrome P450 [Gloeopeniophorella convolvens]|nr:cytochrome P450 [Gloeopeniophorella convolvens]
MEAPVLRLFRTRYEHLFLYRICPRGSGCLRAYNYVRHRNTFLSRLRGPESSSFWFGNDRDIRYQNEVGDLEFKWMERFGTAWRRAGCFGSDRLMVLDPKALQYILQTSGYAFPKSAERAEFVGLIAGKGIVYAQGDSHHRQRKIMDPAFFAPQTKSFLPLFQNSASKLVQKWKDELVANDPSGRPLVNMHRWLSRATLDIIGEAGFDYQFGALDDETTPFSAQYEDIFIDSTLYPAWWDTLFKATWQHIPRPFFGLIRYLPTREYRRFRHFLDYARSFSRDLLKTSLAKGDGKDIMSVLLRANQSGDPGSKMTEGEVVDQIAALLLAGHDTTSNTLTWFFWEVAKHPEAQQRIRAEISALRQKKSEFDASDLESLSYTQAALKEAMRLHPISWALSRVASRDDVIPMAFPVFTESGERVTSIPIKRGTMVDISVAAYNRFPEVWGQDAAEWNPERFLNLDKTKQTSLGMYANLMNFAGGHRACIGWRFAVLEMQAIATTLLENFEFSLPPQDERTRIRRMPTHIMMPMAAGEKGAWMGLFIKPLN